MLAAILLKVLPESPRYLARLKERWPELRDLLGRLGHNVPVEATFVDTTEKGCGARIGWRLAALRSTGATRFALCGSFFFCLLSVYIGTTWVPSMLAGTGFDVGTASYGLTAYNVGGVVGAVLGAIVIMRVGSRSRC